MYLSDFVNITIVQFLNRPLFSGSDKYTNRKSYMSVREC